MSYQKPYYINFINKNLLIYLKRLKLIYNKKNNYLKYEFKLNKLMKHKQVKSRPIVSKLCSLFDFIKSISYKYICYKNRDTPYIKGLKIKSNRLINHINYSLLKARPIYYKLYTYFAYNLYGRFAKSLPNKILIRYQPNKIMYKKLSKIFKTKQYINHIQYAQNLSKSKFYYSPKSEIEKKIIIDDLTNQIEDLKKKKSKFKKSIYVKLKVLKYSCNLNQYYKKYLIKFFKKGQQKQKQNIQYKLLSYWYQRDHFFVKTPEKKVKKKKQLQNKNLVSNRDLNLTYTVPKGTYMTIGKQMMLTKRVRLSETSNAEFQDFLLKHPQYLFIPEFRYDFNTSIAVNCKQYQKRSQNLMSLSKKFMKNNIINETTNSNSTINNS
jgi:hypothetical protein